jgi:outer membrane protein assembly factor BamD (BamD/ComL family)
LGKRTRITKKALKHDAFVDTATKGTKFVEQHMNKLLIAAAVAIVAAGVVLMVIRGQKSAGREASALLAVATESLSSGLLAQAADQFNGIIDEYPGTRSAGAATCHLGSIRFHEQDYDGALQYFEKYLSDYGDPGNLRVIALEGKASILEQRRDFPGAAAVYTTLADEAKDQPMSAALDLLGAIRCYRAAQNWQGMRDAAARIVQDYPDTPSAGDARIAFAEASAFLSPQ